MDLKFGDIQETALITLAIRASETARPNARILHIEGGIITEHYSLNEETIGKLGSFFTEQIG